MRKHLLLLLALVFAAGTLHSQILVDVDVDDEPLDPIKVCGVKLVKFKVSSPVQGVAYRWKADSGATVKNTYGEWSFVQFDAADEERTIEVKVYAVNEQAVLFDSGYVLMKVDVPPSPVITTNVRVGCEQLEEPSDDRPDPTLFEPDGGCLQVCEGSPVVYTTPYHFGSKYSWTVTGGTGVAQGNQFTVVWGGVGQGTVQVTESNGNGCSASASICVRIIAKPRAHFGIAGSREEVVTVCLNQQITFIDQSDPNAGSPLENWYWDFGDRTSYSSSTTSNPVHSYTRPGTYYVRLTVKNACNCTDTYVREIRVMDEPGVSIECVSVVCERSEVLPWYNVTVEGQRLRCERYTWTTNEGTIVGSGPAIQVNWNRVGDDGFGYLTFDPRECDTRCQSPVTVKVPVIKSEIRLQGEREICAGGSFIYRAPAWPGTQFNWEVIGSISGPLAFLPTDQPNEIVFNPAVGETVTIVCNYWNELVGCGGTGWLEVRVRDAAIFNNPITRACANGEVTYELTGNVMGTWNWVIRHPSGTVTTAPAGVLVLNQLVAGVYEISVNAANFCVVETVRLLVTPAPVPPASLTGPDEACTGMTLQYSAGPFITGTTFLWETVPNNGPNAATVQGSTAGPNASIRFNGSGNWTVRVRRQNLDFPNCSSGYIEKIVRVPVNDPQISGPTHGCPNTIVGYTALYSNGETYEWSISPSTAGSVKSGNNTPSVNIQWNHSTSTVVATITVKVRKCGITETRTLQVTINPSPVITLSAPDEVCAGESFTISMSSVPGFNNADVSWEMMPGTVISTTSAGPNPSLIYAYPNTQTSNTNYTIVATVTNINGCVMNTTVTATKTIMVKPAPVVSLTPGGIYYYCKEPINQPMTAVLQSGLGSTSMLTWYTPTGVINCPAPFTNCNPITATTLGSYWVVAMGSNGCSSESNTVQLLESCPPKCDMAFVPDFFIGKDVDCGNTAIVIDYTPGGFDPHWSTIPLNAASNVTVNHGTNTSSWSGQFPNAGNYVVKFTIQYLDKNNEPCEFTVFNPVTVPLMAKLSYGVTCTGNGGYDVTVYDRSNYLPGTQFDHFEYDLLDASGNLLQTDVSQNTSWLISNLAPGIYKLRSRVYYSYNGSSVTSCASEEETIELPALPVANFSFLSQNKCEGVPIVFLNNSTPANTTANPLTYHWDFGDQSSSLLENPVRVYDYVSPQAFPVELIVSNQYGCTSSSVKYINISENQLAGTILLSGANPKCENGGTTSLTFLSQGSAPSVYFWMNDRSLYTTTGQGGNTIQLHQTGNYWVRVENANGCYLNAEPAKNINVISVPDPVINGPRTVCEGEPFRLNTFAGDPTFMTYYWEVNVNNTGWVAVNGISNPLEVTEANGLAPGFYQYRVEATVYDPIVCSKMSALHTIIVNPRPDVPVIQPVQLNDCGLYNLTLSATATGSGVFNWSDGQSGSSIDVFKGGYYKVWFTSGNGCESEAEVYVPKDPRGYLWVMPEGCYERCIDQDGILIPGPIIPFVYWEWNLNGLPYISGTNSVPDDLQIFAAGNYGLTLDNGLCRASTTRALQLSLPRDCFYEVGCSFEMSNEQLHRNFETEACRFNLSFDVFNSSNTLISFTVTPDAGTLVPGGGVLGMGGTTNYTGIWTPPPGNSGQVTFIVRFWLPDGTMCEARELRYDYDCRAEAKPITTLLPQVKNESILLKVIPNPAFSESQVRYDYGNDAVGRMRSIDVYDINGRMVSSHVTRNRTGVLRLDVSGNSSGVYLVVMKENGMLVRMEKMVVVRR